MIMKFSIHNYIVLIFIIVIISISLTECTKEEPAKYPKGTFPATVFNLESINSEYDDYNTTLSEISGYLSLIFSTNRKSSGGQFDLEQALIFYTWDQSTGLFGYGSEITNDPFLAKLINAAETPLDDFGPYQTFSSSEGYEYFIVSSESPDGNLDLKYLKNIPRYGSTLPDIQGPFPVKLLNTSFDDAYLSFDLRLDSAYYISNIDGNFDIFVKTRSDGMDLSTWFNSDYSVSEKVDSINSLYEDKCPMLYHNLMFFTSDRPGGYGGYDIYYSRFRNGNWCTPVNLGPGINTASDEYRPLISYHPDFTNIFLIFSSDRPGGKGGFDLYFTGLDIPAK
jgi:hypothetical protein